MPLEHDTCLSTRFGVVVSCAKPAGSYVRNPPDGDDAALVLAHGHQKQHGLGLPLHVNEVVPRAGARVEEALAAQHVRRCSAPQHLRYLVARSDPNTKGKPNLGTGRSEYKL